jgi:hypothetical protein
MDCDSPFFGRYEPCILDLTIPGSDFKCRNSPFHTFGATDLSLKWLLSISRAFLVFIIPPIPRGELGISGENAKIFARDENTASRGVRKFPTLMLRPFPAGIREEVRQGKRPLGSPRPCPVHMAESSARQARNVGDSGSNIRGIPLRLPATALGR